MWKKGFLIVLALLSPCAFGWLERPGVGGGIQGMKSDAWRIANRAMIERRRANNASTLQVLPKSTYVRMRDGTLLYTVYWDPRLDSKTQIPTVVVRSPYGWLGTENMALLYVPFGFAVVEQNERGTGKSDGDFCFWQLSQNDGYDTMEWIQRQEWSNGQVFQVGASADGILSTLDMKRPQPAMFGQWLMVTTAFPYATLFQNNEALRLSLSKDWLSIIQSWRPNIPKNTYFDAAVRNEGINSHFLPPGFACGSNFSWTHITMSDEDFKNVDFPAVFTGGWYDIFLDPMLRTFAGYDTESTGIARGNQQFFIEPRGHCFFETEVSFRDDRLAWIWSYERSVDIFKARTTAATRRIMPPSPKEIRAAQGKLLEFQKWTLYVMGPKGAKGEENTGMYFTTLPQWPTPNNQQLFLNPGRQLLPQVPSNGTLSYVYNPNSTTPTNGGNNLFLRCGPANNMDNDLRSDNLYFDTAPFQQPISMLGSVVVSLRVTSNCTDTDFVVRLSDVYPEGNTSMLLGDNVVRMRWRDSDAVPSLMQPGKPYVITIKLWPLCYTWNVGHRLRIAVTSSNAPRYSPNPNNGNLVWEGGAPLIALNSVLLGADTWVSIPTLPPSQLPKMKIL